MHTRREQDAARTQQDSTTPLGEGLRATKAWSSVRWVLREAAVCRPAPASQETSLHIKAPLLPSFPRRHPLSGRISLVTPSVVTPRGGSRLFVGRCILCRGRRSRFFFLSCFGRADASGVCFGFWMDLTEPDVVYVSNTGGGCPRVSAERSAVERFPCLECFKRKQPLKSRRAEKGPLTLGGTWRATATNTSAQTKPSGASRWTTAESWGTLSLRVRTPHPENTNTLSDRPRTATGTKPLPRDTAPHASRPV